MTKLIVSVDPVALLRSSRNSPEPDPVHFALQAELAGAGGIRAHLRIDRKYISQKDVELLNRLVKTKLYLQMSPHQDIVHLVNGIRPHNIIMAAERRQEKTSDHGLDVALLAGELQGIIRNIDTRHTRVFLFVDPNFDQIKAAAKLGVHGLLINAQALQLASAAGSASKPFQQLKDAVKLTAKYGLEAHLTHGITVETAPLLQQLQGIRAIHIGHQLAARSLQIGVMEAVKYYLRWL